ncbi:MAG: MATE family efflux transporter [Longimicrobiales bacterium]
MAPALLDLINAALRSAGDAKTPLRIGIVVTVLNVILNVILITGLGPVPAFETAGAAMGTVISAGAVSLYALWRLIHGGWVVSFPRGGPWAPDLSIGPVDHQAALLVHHVDLRGAHGRRRYGGRPEPGRRQPRAVAGCGAGGVANGVGVAIAIGALFLFIPQTLLGLFGLEEASVLALGTELLTFLAFSGIFVSVALTYTGGLQGTGATKSPLYISIVSQIVVPLGMCFVIQQVSTLDSWEIWLAILLGHVTRSTLSVFVFRRGGWRDIEVEIEPAR